MIDHEGRQRITPILAQGHRVIIDDVRTASEVAAIRERGGLVWRITRDGIERTSEHSSETLPPYDRLYHNSEKDNGHD